MKTCDAIILVGGLGTRLKTVITDLPKPLAPVLGKPFLNYLLEHLDKLNQINRVILATAYQSQKIRALYADHHYHFKIDFSEEDHPLGTGGAVRLALEKTNSPRVLILNGDSFIDFDYNHFEHEETLLLKRVEDRSRFGSIELDNQNKIVALREKGLSGEGLISAGVYLLKKESLMEWPLQQVISMEMDILPKLIKKGLYGKICDRPFIDIGTPESYQDAQIFFKELQG